MKRTTYLLLFLAQLLHGAPDVILVIGEPGEPVYANQFDAAHEDWTNLFTKADIDAIVLGVASNELEVTDLSLLSAALTNQVESPESFEPLWLILHGHGSFDGRDGRFNLRGPDLTATQLAELLPADRDTVVIASFASSVAFLPALSASNRVVISATRDLGEDSFSYFGGFLPKAMANPEADVDQDGAVSVLEAWLLASKLTAEHYVNEQRILTEHPLFDDNGDQKGTPVTAFRGVRAQPLAEGAVADGLRAQQLHLVPSAAERAMTAEARAKRDVLERELLLLRDRKSEMEEVTYYAELKAILLKLGKVYAE